MNYAGLTFLPKASCNLLFCSEAQRISFPPSNRQISQLFQSLHCRLLTRGSRVSTLKHLAKCRIHRAFWMGTEGCELVASGTETRTRLVCFLATDYLLIRRVRVSCSSWILGTVSFMLWVLRLISMLDLFECLGEEEWA